MQFPILDILRFWQLFLFKNDKNSEFSQRKSVFSCTFVSFILEKCQFCKKI